MPWSTSRLLLLSPRLLQHASVQLVSVELEQRDSDEIAKKLHAKAYGQKTPFDNKTEFVQTLENVGKSWNARKPLSGQGSVPDPAVIFLLRQ